MNFTNVTVVPSAPERPVTVAETKLTSVAIAPTSFTNISVVVTASGKDE